MAVGTEYYIQVVGDTAQDVGAYTLSLSSSAGFQVTKVDGTCSGDVDSAARERCHPSVVFNVVNPHTFNPTPAFQRASPHLPPILPPRRPPILPPYHPLILPPRRPPSNRASSPPNCPRYRPRKLRRCQAALATSPPSGCTIPRTEHRFERWSTTPPRVSLTRTTLKSVRAQVVPRLSTASSTSALRTRPAAGSLTRARRSARRPTFYLSAQAAPRVPPLFPMGRTRLRSGALPDWAGSSSRRTVRRAPSADAGRGRRGA
jgi:hypothetical protein